MISKSVDVMRENWLFYAIYIIAEAISLVLSGALRGQHSALISAAPHSLPAILAPMSLGVLVLLVNLLPICLAVALPLFVFRALFYNTSFASLPRDHHFRRNFIKLGVKAAILSVISLIPVGVFQASMKHWFAVSATNPDLTRMLPVFVVSALSSSAVFSYFGTWLAASIYNEKTSFAAAKARGDKTFLPVFIRMAPITLASFCLLAVLSHGATILGVSSGISNASQIIPSAIFKLLQLVINAFYMTFSAVILSHYYFEVEAIKHNASQQAKITNAV